MSDVDELLVPAKVLAACFDLSERRVQQLAAQGVIPRAAHGKYPLVESVRGWAKWWRDQISGKAERISKDESRAKLMQAKAESATVQAELLRATVYRRDEVEAVFGAALGIVANHLAGLGGRVCGEVAPITEPRVIAGVIDRETREIRERCARELGRLGKTSADRRASDAPAAEAKRRRVGGRKPRAPTRVV